MWIVKRLAYIARAETTSDAKLKNLRRKFAFSYFAALNVLACEQPESVKCFLNIMIPAMIRAEEDRNSGMCGNSLGLFCDKYNVVDLDIYVLYFTI